MQAQSAPSPYQAPTSPYQTASAPAVGAAFQPAPQAARGLIPPFAQKPDKNRLPRDFGFFHFTDAVSYLREIAGYQWWRPLFTLLIVLGWIGVFELAAVLTLRSIIRELVYGGAIRYLAAMEGSVPLWLYILINFGVTAVIFLPPTLIGTVMADGRPVSTLTSRYSKMRWKTLAWCTGVAFFWAFLIILLPKIIAGPDFLISRLDTSGYPRAMRCRRIPVPRRCPPGFRALDTPALRPYRTCYPGSDICFTAYPVWVLGKVCSLHYGVMHRLPGAVHGRPGSRHSNTYR